MGILRQALAIWHTNPRHEVASTFAGSRYNPLTIVRQTLWACPDEFAHPGTSSLSFVADRELRSSLRIDISAANSSLSAGGWKAGTVLAGSVIEALLLSAIDSLRSANTSTYDAALASLSKPPPPDLEEWGLAPLIAVAESAGLITGDTASQCRLAQGFRNLIHPGRTLRLGQSCNRATALSALAAVEHVIEDLQSGP